MIEINKIYNEPCLDTLRKMDDKSIDCVITSPPYWMLRDYGYPEQWGLEPTFQEYLAHLWEMMDEIYRVLKDTGTVWINLGDTYGTTSGNIKQGNLATNKIKYTGGIIGYTKPGNFSKSLLLLPHRFAIGCIDRGWKVRNDIIWAKRNGMPESVTDRFSKKHEYFFFMVKSDKYYFDIDGIRDVLKNPVSIRNKASEEYGRGSGTKQFSEGERVWGDEDKGKNPGSVSDFWDIPTKPSSKKHYAQYNDELLKKPIIAGCPKGGVVYDPFTGTGTTQLMCLRTDRNYIGSEMGKEYYDETVKQLDLISSQKTIF